MISSFGDRLISGLYQIYDAERMFWSAQQEMLPKASSRELHALLDQHIAETQQQILNLERVMQRFGNIQPMRSDAANGLVLEGQNAMRMADGGAIMDTVIADAMAKVEHYEIAAYRSLMVIAEQAGQPDIVHALRQNLAQEERTAELVEQALPTLIGGPVSDARTLGRI